MRVAYLFSMPSPSYGILEKMQDYAATARRHRIAIDFHCLMTGRTELDRSAYPDILFAEICPEMPSGRRGHFRYHALLARRINDCCREYDRIVLRYPAFHAALALFLRHRERIHLEHHTKEDVELRVVGNRKWIQERLFGGRFIRGFAGLIAVTPEILAYQVARSGFNGPTIFLPNCRSISPSIPDVELIGQTDACRLVCSANTLQAWQGLEIIRNGLAADRSGRLELHLAGGLDEPTRQELEGQKSILCHGHLDPQRLAALYRRCHAGIGPFNHASIQLTQATSLKTREYLANGLPVIQGYRDPAFPADFPFILRLETFDPSAVVAYLDSLRGTGRRAVAAAAEPVIDPSVMLRRMYSFVVRG